MKNGVQNMKRSEMISIIKSAWVDSSSFPTDDLVAKYILDKIEAAGMLAPETVIYTDMANGNTLCAPVFAWDFEDPESGAV